MTTAEFRWELIREGNVGIVIEHRPDGSRGQWRVPAQLVPAFVRARRTLMHHKMTTLMKAVPSEPHDFSFLREPHHDVPSSASVDRSDKRDPRSWGATIDKAES